MLRGIAPDDQATTTPSSALPTCCTPRQVGRGVFSRCAGSCFLSVSCLSSFLCRPVPWLWWTPSQGVVRDDQQTTRLTGSPAVCRWSRRASKPLSLSVLWSNIARSGQQALLDSFVSAQRAAPDSDSVCPNPELPRRHSVVNDRKVSRARRSERVQTGEARAWTWREWVGKPPRRRRRRRRRRITLDSVCLASYRVVSTLPGFARKMAKQDNGSSATRALVMVGVHQAESRPNRALTHSILSASRPGTETTIRRRRISPDEQ